MYSPIAQNFQISEATKRAKEMAIEFSRDSVSKLGGIKSATQGSSPYPAKIH
jgi:hypothetical protein